MKIAVDAMGGDNAPQVIIEGVEEARDLYPDLEFDLYGNVMPSSLREILGQFWRLASSLLAALKGLIVQDLLVFCQLPSRVLVDTILSTSILVQMLKVKRKIWNNMPTLANSMLKMYWELRSPGLRY